MASFAAFLEVKGNRFPLLSYTLGIHQETDSLGRPASPTLGGTIDCVLSAPGSDQPFLLQWMFSPTMQEDGKIILMQDSPKATLKTISFFNAYCVGLQTNFTPGAGGGGSLQMHIRISPQRVAVGAIIHDNNWPLVSHGAGETFAPQPKPKPKKGLATPYEYPIDIPQPKPPAPTKTEPTKTQPPSPRKPPSLPKLPRIPRNVPSVPPLPHPVLVFLAALLGWHDAGVANEWEHKLPEKDERRYRELEAKRSKEIAKGGKLAAWEEEEFQALDKKKYPSGHSPHAQPKAPDSDDDLVYAPTPKHRKGGWGTYMDLDDQTAQEVLRESTPSGKQRYGYKDGKVYVFQPDNVGGYHGYPLTDRKPPQAVLDEWKDKGILTEAEYRKLIKRKPQ